jgi:DMSO/TMAO reductase YedYZ molybdopterin-dependent catalytic subunit
MKIRVIDEIYGQKEFTVEEMTALALRHVSMSDRMPDVEGRAFELQEWYRSWQKQLPLQADHEPTRVFVEAVDEFQAMIPWNQLSDAVFLYEQNGAPLIKGYPIRLYVPNGSSECLHVKSVVMIRFDYQPSSTEASFGFKNHISLDELTVKKK